METIRSQPFLVAILAGAAAQVIKVVSFLLVEKAVNYKRFVQADGSPNMHSAAMSALAVSIGLKDGFGSIVFALALCLTVLVMVDTWNVKRAASRNAEVIVLIVERIRSKGGRNYRAPESLSYTHMDVLIGTVFGIAVTLLLT